jgi:hypothetical protein
LQRARGLSDRGFRQPISVSVKIDLTGWLPRHLICNIVPR